MPVTEEVLRQRQANRESYYRHIEERRARCRAYAAKRRATDPAYKERIVCWNVDNKDQINEKRCARRRLTPEKSRQETRQWREANPQWSKEYYKKNVGEFRRRYREWSKRNPGSERLRATKRRSAVQIATPAWANEDAILAVYTKAKRLQEVTGVKYDVDHIVPLRGKAVCGLHWEGNLQVLMASENRRKSNRCQ